MSNRLTAKEFIQRATLIHDDKFDYSEVIYINSFTKINIICKAHGVFSQTPNSHLNGNGCIKCAGSYKPTTEEFIQRAILVHGDKFDYSEVVYVNNFTKIKIICKIHGAFEKTPSNHIHNQGCPKCKYDDPNYPGRVMLRQRALQKREKKK